MPNQLVAPIENALRYAFKNDQQKMRAERFELPTF